VRGFVYLERRIRSTVFVERQRNVGKRPDSGR
jgi:hypothetical protein